MDRPLSPGDRVKVLLPSRTGQGEEWFEGTVVRIEPYSQHRSFHWVELEAEAQAALGTRLISVFNPRKIQRI